MTDFGFEDELDHNYLRPKREPHPRDYFGLNDADEPDAPLAETDDQVPTIFSLFENDGPGAPPYEPPSHKLCPRCQRWLPLGAYYRNRYFRDGRQINCSECGRETAREYYRRHADRLRPAGRERMRRKAAARNAARAETTTTT